MIFDKSVAKEKIQADSHGFHSGGMQSAWNHMESHGFARISFAMDGMQYKCNPHGFHSHGFAWNAIRMDPHGIAWISFGWNAIRMDSHGFHFYCSIVQPLEKFQHSKSKIDFASCLNKKINVETDEKCNEEHIELSA